jgi:N5-(carboxyethyl)ornithine synthase
MDDPHSHILTIEQQRLLKKGKLIIDAAADAGNAIEGTKYTSIGDPIYSINWITYYEVNNSPSILYRKSSVIISESMSKWIFPRDFADFYSLLNNN